MTITMKAKRWVIALVAVSTLGALAACTSSGSGDASAAGSGGVAGGSEAGAASAPAASGDVAAKAPAVAPAPADAGVVDLTDPRSLIQTADLDVLVKHGRSVDAAADRAAAIVATAGGLVYADERTSGHDPSAQQTFKVPPDELSTVLDRLAGLGKQESRNLSTQDVTATVVDVTSRVRSAQLAIDTLNGLYQRATKLSDIIRLENELAQREANLESLQAQQRTLTAETAEATVQLSLESAPKKVVKHHHVAAGRGIGTGLSRGWHAFGTAAVWTASTVATLLPFLAVALLLGGAAVVIRRRTHTAAPVPAPSGDSPAG
jgi:hypothetical protein